MKLPLSSVPVAAHVRARREAAIGQSPAATCQRLIDGQCLLEDQERL